MSTVESIMEEMHCRDGLLPPSEASTTWERFRRIRAAYANHQRRVDAGFASWFLDDPYGIADWVMIFTPIEAAAWHIYRASGRVCMVDFERPEDWNELSPDKRRAWEEDVEARSLKPILEDIRRDLEMAGAMKRGRKS